MTEEKKENSYQYLDDLICDKFSLLFPTFENLYQKKKNKNRVREQN
jgi:hypothetical protein